MVKSQQYVPAVTRSFLAAPVAWSLKEMALLDRSIPAFY